MLEVDAAGVTFEKLASSEVFNQAGGHFDFRTLDAKLGSAFCHFVFPQPGAGQAPP